MFDLFLTDPPYNVNYHGTAETIKNTKCTAILIEVCFVDNKQDAEIFKKLGYEKIAKAIYNAII